MYRAVSTVDAEVVSIELIAADVVDTILESSANENPIEEAEGEAQSTTKNSTLADGAAASNANLKSAAVASGAQTLQSHQTTAIASQCSRSSKRATIRS